MAKKIVLKLISLIATYKNAVTEFFFKPVVVEPTNAVKRVANLFHQANGDILFSNVVIPKMP